MYLMGTIAEKLGRVFSAKNLTVNDNNEMFCFYTTYVLETIFVECKRYNDSVIFIDIETGDFDDEVKHYQGEVVIDFTGNEINIDNTCRNIIKVIEETGVKGNKSLLETKPIKRERVTLIEGLCF